MEDKELKEVLDSHKKWLSKKDDGVRANFRHANLRGVDLRCVDLQDADLQGADLQGAYLRGADLWGADLRGADLQGAYLRGAYLWGADLQGADLRGANLWGADLQGAYLRGAYIDYATWPLWCGSLDAYIDDRIAIQLLYHLLRPVQASPYASQEVKERLLTDDLIDLANRFHRAEECGEIER